MESLKLRVRVLCVVGLTGAAAAACGDLPTQGQPSSGGATSSAGSDSNPGSSGTTAIASGGSTPVSSGGSGGTAGSDSTAGSSSSGASAGGTGGTSGSGGTAGTDSTAGSGGSGGSPAPDPCLHTGPRTRTDLTPTNGRVECTTNDFGIEGDWKINSSDPQLMTSNFSGSMVCASGTIARVIATPTSMGMPDFGRYWGGGLAFVLHTLSAGGTGFAYDATANGLAGISLKITANTGTLPAQMRFKFKMIGTNNDFCKEVDNATSGDTITLKTGDAVHNCWAPDTMAVLDPTMLENYEVQVVSQASMAVPFDFCLSQITALAAP
jgi:hypothetical protein